MNYCRPRLPVCSLYLKTARPDKRQEGTRPKMLVNSTEHKFKKSPRFLIIYDQLVYFGGVFQVTEVGRHHAEKSLPQSDHIH